MKTSQLSLSILALGFAVMPLNAASQSVKTFQGYYDRFTKAFVLSDWESVTALVAKDFHAKGPDGRTVTWSAIVSEFKRQRSSLKSVKWPRTVKSVVFENDKAVVVVDGHMSGVMSDAGGKPHQLIFDAITKDTWIKGAGGWQLQSSNVIKSAGSFDGKPIGSH
jgi:hypothetical protein